MEDKYALIENYDKILFMAAENARENYRFNVS